MAKTRQQLHPSDVDLAQIRKAKRLLNRALKELSSLEATIVKWRKVDKPKAGNEEGRALATKLYKDGKELADVIDNRLGVEPTDDNFDHDQLFNMDVEEEVA